MVPEGENSQERLSDGEEIPSTSAHGSSSPILLAWGGTSCPFEKEMMANTKNINLNGCSMTVLLHKIDHAEDILL